MVAVPASVYYIVLLLLKHLKEQTVKHFIPENFKNTETEALPLQTEQNINTIIYRR